MKPRNAQAREEVEKLITYLNNNAHRIGYSESSDGGYAIGSGGSGRRSGMIVIHNAQAILTPGQDPLTQVCDLFGQRERVPPRLRIALGIIHDTTCSREFANGFAQSFTALEVLTRKFHK